LLVEFHDQIRTYYMRSRRPLPYPDAEADPVRLATTAAEHGLIVQTSWATGAARLLACPSCGAEWALPPEPYVWLWVFCANRCNVPKDPRLIRDLFMRVARCP
jgi:hypothetical protein